MQIDLLKSAVANVLLLINATNTTAFTAAELSIGTPAVWVDPAELNTRNTQVTVTSLAGSGYSGSVIVRYTRLTLEHVRGVKVLDYTLLGDDTVAGIKAYVVAALGVVADQVELNISTVPVIPDGTESIEIQIQAIPGSLLYTGSTSVTTFPVGDDTLEELITNPELEGFDI
jgi:hypothetical protein